MAVSYSNGVKRLATLLLSVLLAGTAPADSTDGAWNVQSDTYEILLDERQVTYVGNVVAEQGEYRIKADRLRAFFNEKNEVIRMEAHGAGAAQAQLESLQAPEETRLHGDSLFYNLSAARVTARGNTLFVRGHDKMNAHELTYNLNEERVVANRNATDRVRVVLFPEGSRTP